MTRDTAPLLFTLGHSNHAAEPFLALLRTHGIGCVADVRSRPYSRWPQFGRERLATLLAGAGVDYVWLGEQLGGRPAEPALLAADGTPDYAAIARAPGFQAGLAVLRERLDGPRPVTVLCSEGDPLRCHREHLIARALRPLGVTVRHILRDGTLAAPPDGEGHPAADGGATSGGAPGQLKLDL